MAIRLGGAGPGVGHFHLAVAIGVRGFQPIDTHHMGVHRLVGLPFGESLTQAPIDIDIRWLTQHIFTGDCTTRSVQSLDSILATRVPTPFTIDTSLPR